MNSLRQAAWIIPFAVLGVLYLTLDPEYVRATDSEVWAMAIVHAFGLTAGGLWQLAYRRDLVERLVGLCALYSVFTMAGPLWVETHVSHTLSNLGESLVSGLVLTELFLRHREAKNASDVRATAA